MLIKKVFINLSSIYLFNYLSSIYLYIYKIHFISGFGIKEGYDWLIVGIQYASINLTSLSNIIYNIYYRCVLYENKKKIIHKTTTFEKIL